MRNKILRSVNAKHHSSSFFYKINQRDLPLMHSCAFRCEFIDLVFCFFGSTEKQPAVRTLYQVYSKAVCGSKTHRIADFLDQRQT